MAEQIISHIRIGFQGIVQNGNYMDCHQPLNPFGLNWGRGLLIRAEKGFFAVTCAYVETHSRLKCELEEQETTAGAFYYGYVRATKTLYLEYASDNMFDFRDEGILPIIMDALKECPGPLKGYVLTKKK